MQARHLAFTNEIRITLALGSKLKYSDGVSRLGLGRLETHFANLGLSLEGFRSRLGLEGYRSRDETARLQKNNDGLLRTRGSYRRDHRHKQEHKHWFEIVE